MNWLGYSQRTLDAAPVTAITVVDMEEALLLTGSLDDACSPWNPRLIHHQTGQFVLSQGRV